MRKLKALGFSGGLLVLLGACGGDDTQPGGSNGSDASSGGNTMTSSGGAAGSNAGGTAMTGGAGGSGGAAGNAGTAQMAGAAGSSINDASPGADAATAPITIASALGKPTGIALGATLVYWADEAKGTISSCPKTGCGASSPTLVVSTPAPRGIALRGTSLYWITAGDADAAVAATVAKCMLGACAANQIVDLGMGRGNGPFGNVGIAADDQRVYLVGGPTIQTCSVAGCGDGGFGFGYLGGVTLGPHFGVAVDATTAYMGRAFGAVSACPLAGCSSPEDETLLVSAPPTLAIAIDAANVYWSEAYFFNAALYDASIRTCPKTGCALGSAKVMAAGSIVPYALAVDETSLFYTDYRNGRVERIPKNDFAHTCVANHLAACEACAGSILCDGRCSASCDAGPD